MVLIASERLLTADDVDRLPEDGFLRELVHGELREWMSPGPSHGWIETRIAGALDQFVTPRGLGFVLSGEVRFLIKGDPSHYRMADVAFVLASKYPDGVLPEKADATEPDLIIEIVSPDDIAEMTQEKIRDWIDAGARLIWYVYPRTRNVVVHKPDGTATTIAHTGVLDGADVIPGLQLPVNSFLP